MHRERLSIKYVLSKWQLFLMLTPALVVLIIFAYVPMYGVIIAFQNFSPGRGMFRSEWVGLLHFRDFFASTMFNTTLRNTILLSLYSILWGFPLPIIFALFLNQMRFMRFKRFVQTVSYAPFFISTVVMVSMLNLFLAPSNGFINILLGMIGIGPINFMIRAEWFRTVYIASEIWQGTGWGAIIYLAALSAVSPDLYEASTIDGASKWQRILYIDIPSIVPTIAILLILRVGNLMSVGFERALLMQQGMNITTSEIIATYVYKIGLMGAQHSLAGAIGLFNSLINFALLLMVNSFVKKISGWGLW